MEPVHRLILPILTTILVLAGAAVAHCEPWRGSVGLGVEFATGTFGTVQRTDTVTAPLTITVSPTKRIDFSLEIPYLYQSGGSVTSSVNRSISGQQMHLMAQSGHMPMGGSGGINPSSPGSPQDPSTVGASNGIGDITAKAGYLIVDEGDTVPAVRATVAVKIPTADKDKALGTGTFDEAATLEVYKWLGDWYTFAAGGYTVQGKVAEVPLKNYVTYNASLGYQLTDAFVPLVLLKGSTAAADGTDATLQVRLKGIWAVTEKTALEGYLSKGLTAASPDLGAGVAVFHYF